MKVKRTDMYRRPTETQLKGLEKVESLAYADVSVDAERWPSDDPVHSGLAYLRKLIASEKQLRAVRRMS